MPGSVPRPALSGLLIVRLVVGYVIALLFIVWCVVLSVCIIFDCGIS